MWIITVFHSLKSRWSIFVSFIFFICCCESSFFRNNFFFQCKISSWYIHFYYNIILCCLLCYIFCLINQVNSLDFVFSFIITSNRYKYRNISNSGSLLRSFRLNLIKYFKNISTEKLYINFNGWRYWVFHFIYLFWFSFT